MDRKKPENKAKKFFSKINKKIDDLLEESEISKEDIKKGINERIEELKRSRDETAKEFKKIREENKEEAEAVEKFVHDAKDEIKKAWTNIFSKKEGEKEKPGKKEPPKSGKE